MGRIQSIFNKLIPKRAEGEPDELLEPLNTPEDPSLPAPSDDVVSDPVDVQPIASADDAPAETSSHEGWRLYIPPGTEQYVAHETNEPVSHADSILVNGDTKKRASADFKLDAIRDIDVSASDQPAAPQTERVPLVPPPAELNSSVDEASLSEPYTRDSFTHDPEGFRERSDQERGSRGPRGQDELTPIFHETQEPEERGSISLMLLPVSPPDLQSLAPLYLEEVNDLYHEQPTPQRDERLLYIYERYLSIVPNHMGVWREFSDLLIELKGTEFASQVIHEGLEIVADSTPLLVILTEMSRRMCDYITAAHYIERAVELQPHNIEVLELLRDIQRENKMFQSASDTDSLIQALERDNSLND